jgi:predicted RNase H-like nuclease
LKTRLIGIDCACSSKNIGIALGERDDSGELRVLEAACGGNVVSTADTLVDWLKDANTCLLAFDAPLGWPAAMGVELASHAAGQPIVTEPNSFFRRETDRVICRHLGKTPLDVGADRIARTAHSALMLLQQVREGSGLEIPLVWGVEAAASRVSAIEVYPAGTLLAHGMPATGYKKADQRSVREIICDHLSQMIAGPMDVAALLNDADVLDAVVCLIAASDFLKGCCILPVDLVAAKREGWIWVRQP